MAVDGGHFLNPIEIPGLAHLCEHLVVGAKTTGLHSEVTRAGGLCNAYTSSTQKCFGFELSTYAKNLDSGEHSSAIDTALPRFARYFSLLKFHLDVMSREIRSVHDEHLGNTINVEKILCHGLKIMASNSHPFHRFSTGNMVTLTKCSSRTLKTNIKSHYAQYFQPENMTLVLKGPQSSHHLKRLVITHFGFLNETQSRRVSPSLLRPNSTSSSSISGYSINSGSSCRTTEPDVFQDLDPNVLYIKADFSPRLRLCFPMNFGGYSVPGPVQRQICHLLGTESPGSWCQFLKCMTQYLLNVYVSIEEICPTHNILVCDLEMTKKGMRNLQEVLSLFFFYIEERILSVPLDTLTGVLDNFGRIEESLFQRMQPLHSSMNEVSEYASRIKIDGIDKNLIRGYQPWELGMESCKSMVSAFQKALCRTKVRIQILDKTFMYQSAFANDSTIVAEGRDEHYGFEYIKLDYRLTKPNSSPAYFEGIAVFDLFHHSESAIPITANIPLGQVKHRDIDSGTNTPIFKIKEENLEIWAHDIPNSHEIFASVSINFPHISATTDKLVGIEIIAAILGDSLKYKLYYMELLGGNWGFYPNINGEPSLLIVFRGEQALLDKAFTEIFLELNSSLYNRATYNYEELRRARLLLRRLSDEHKESQGIAQIEVMSHLLLEGNFVSIEERIETMELVDVEQLTELGKELGDGLCKTSVLISGNSKEVDFDRLMEIFTYPKKSKLTIVASNYIDASKSLPSGAHYVFKMPEIEDDPSSIVYYYVQLGSRLDRIVYSMGKLLQFYLSSTSFDALRTKRSLSYSLLSGMKMFKNTFGLFIFVPANKKDCLMLIELIEDYLLDLETKLVKFSSSEWESFKESFFISLDTVDDENEFPSSLFANLLPLIGSSEFHITGVEFKDHWNNVCQIINRTYAFGGTSCEEPMDKDLIKSLNHLAFCGFFEHKLSVNSTQNSVLVLTKPAGRISLVMRISELANMYSVVLAHAGLIFSVEELTQCLNKCRDKEKFSDASKHIKSLLKTPGQQLSFLKFNVYNKVGELLAPRLLSVPKDKSRVQNTKQYFTKVEEIRNRCHSAVISDCEEIKEQFWDQLNVDAFLECYYSPLSTAKSEVF
ncbi:hypothetical protein METBISCDRAFT_21214 [Metschnikowia bicuspidata]|uniref:Uncharacterized protein n=1 Tax=Metschnikowia bicuspidata TaxID=27322 RepID=A0A4P9ZIT4_9ASCO|nr:hypothetical protein METBISCDRAFT_21214 [Metschnikowia bicuspidata]